MKQVGIKEALVSLGIVGACARKAGGTARQTEPQECSNRCEGGCEAAVELTVRGHDVDFVVQQKEMEKSGISTVKSD